jgi:hypothetical protein
MENPTINETKVKNIIKNYSEAEIRAFLAGAEYGVDALLAGTGVQVEIIKNNTKVYTK